jgi:hypothetical protein
VRHAENRSPDIPGLLRHVSESHMGKGVVDLKDLSRLPAGHGRIADDKENAPQVELLDLCILRNPLAPW